MLTRFLREARAAGELNHRNIIQIYDFGEDGGRAFIVMELLEGANLNEFLRAHPDLSLDRKLQIMIAVCEGLAFSHSRSIIHSDLKSGNLFITTAGQVKVLDFGLARIASSKLTRAGLVFGTPDYMLPEHVRGTVVDVRSDIFSLGAVCYQMLSGRKPFAAKALPEVMRKVLTEEPVPLTRAEAPPSLARVIARALEKDPLNRHQKVEELLADLCKVDPDAPVDAAASEGEPKKIDRYQILERVGRGGMGVVYRARDPVLDRDVAIKSMLVDFGVDQDARGRFQQEARAAARLQHPNIVTIYEFGEQDDSPYLIMEFLGGDDLEGLMRRDPPLSLEHRLDIVAQLCDGLAFAHDQGVVHRDIKPGNVRVLEDGSVKLLDFGIATVQKADTTSGTGTFAGSARSVLRLVMGDVGSHVAAERRLGAATPPIVRTPIHASVVDVGGVEGAAVIRVDSGGVAAAAGLRPGDVIVGVGGTAVTAVSDVARALEDADPGRELLMDVRAEDGTVRATAVRVALAPDTIPLADSRLLYNTILLDLRARAARADDTVLRSASRLGLAIVHMRLGSWDLALGALETVSLPDGSGVSGAAVAYLMGLCLKEVGQLPEARASFSRAVAAGDGTLSVGGPPVGPLAQRQLDRMP